MTVPAVLGDVDLLRGRVDREAEHVPEAVGVDRRPGERVVRGDRAVRVEPEDFAVRILQALAVVLVLSVPDGDVQFAVWAEQEPAAVGRSRENLRSAEARP